MRGKGCCIQLSPDPPDHPRLCGEKSILVLCMYTNMGSPPPMRRKEFLFRVRLMSSGITPAYAGKRAIKSTHATMTRDHPRLCGEKFASYGTSIAPTGSPPPMRGKEQWAKAAGIRAGITPAYAGKSRELSACRRKRQDHPRLCGEKCTKKKQLICALGSPPPMRGKAFSKANGNADLGITPAYAGKRWFRFLSSFALGDHPRLCGEKLCEDNPRAAVAGSPPPMRGKGTGLMYRGCDDGITPAYAGKRQDDLCRDQCTEDHPRLCGEKIRCLGHTS